jgi:hypothetical protein
MTTLAGTPERLQSVFGASPRTVTISAVGVGNSLGIWCSNETGAAMNTVTCGNGTPALIFSFTNLGGGSIEFWIISNITDAPTTIEGTWTGANSYFNVDKAEFVGAIQQHNAQEGFITGSGAGEIGPSLVATAASVGAMGLAMWSGDRSLTPATGLTALPTGVAASCLVYSDNLGAAGTYVIGGTPNIFASDHYIGGVLLEDVPAAGGQPAGRKSPARPMNLGRLFSGGMFRESLKQLNSGLLMPAWV